MLLGYVKYTEIETKMEFGLSKLSPITVLTIN